MKYSRFAQFAGGIALAIAGMAIFFQKVDIHKLGNELVSLNPLTVILVALLSVMTLLFRAWRWKIMLPDQEKASKRGLFPIVTIGFMVNNILPARLGEAARVLLLWKKNGYSPALSIGSIVLERFFDTLAFASCFFIPVFILGAMKTAAVGGTVGGKSLPLQAFALLFGAIFLGACLAVFLYARFPAWSRGRGKKLLRFVPLSFRGKAHAIGKDVLSNLDWVFSLKKVALMVMHTYCIMLCYAVTITVLAKEATFSVLHGLFAQAFAAMGAAIPLAPGYVGTLHAVLKQGLLLCGLSPEKAIATAILYHAIPYCTITLLGLYYFFKMRVSLKDISSMKNTKTPDRNKP
jgi:glycosyltransferase 2 family protein